MKDLLERNTLRPFIFVLSAWFFAFHSTLQPAKTYVLVIFNSLNLPIDSNWLGVGISPDRLILTRFLKNEFVKLCLKIFLVSARLSSTDRRSCICCICENVWKTNVSIVLNRLEFDFVSAIGSVCCTSTRIKSAMGVHRFVHRAGNYSYLHYGYTLDPDGRSISHQVSRFCLTVKA